MQLLNTVTMPVIVLEARDFISTIFLVRTLEVLSGCTTFSLVASLKDFSDFQHINTFWNFCMFIWCFFFTVTLLIHILNVIQFHSLIPISWKNLIITVAVLGALLCLSASAVFPWIIMDQRHPSIRSVAAAVSSGLTALAYTSESYVLCNQAQEQRGYMGSKPGVLKILQLWGGLQIIPLIFCEMQSVVSSWQLWVSFASYGICVLMSLVTLVVILGDFTGRCFLPFDRFLTVFSLTGVFLYMVATVICCTKILHLREHRHRVTIAETELVITEMVVASITLIAYTVDLAFSIKLLCDRSHT